MLVKKSFSLLKFIHFSFEPCELRDHGVKTKFGLCENNLS